MELFSPLVLLDQTNARSDFARIGANEHRCQVRRVTRAMPTTRNVLASISARSGKNGKPVCYNVSAINGVHHMTPKQREMLKSFAEDGEATDIYSFDGASALGWGNRERVMNALRRRGLLDDDGITQAGRDALQAL